jgi:hypothetical protein
VIEIRPTIAADFPAVCNRVNHLTVKAFTVLSDGEPVAIAGVTIERDKFIAFSDIKEGVSAPKMTIWRTAKKLAEHIKELGLPAIATTDNGKFLESIGFQYAGNTENKGIYRI